MKFDKIHMKTMKRLMMAAAAACLATASWGETVKVSNWADLKSNLEAGNDVKLGADIMKNGDPILLDKSDMNVTLDMNGHEMWVLDGYLVKVAEKGTNITFTLKNSGKERGAVNGDLTYGTDIGTVETRGEAIACVLVGKGGTFVFESGVIDGFRRMTGAYGSTVVVEGEFKLTGGTIYASKTTGNKGSGVYVKGGTFIMSGGAISCCEMAKSEISSSLGGGVYVDSGATFEMTGGRIVGCLANQGGGVAVASGGTFNFSSGRITENIAREWGSGVYLLSESTMSFSGGAISNNTTYTPSLMGAGIVSSGKLTMTGGTIAGNTCQSLPLPLAIYSNCDVGDVICGGVVNGYVSRDSGFTLSICGGVFDRDQSSNLAYGRQCSQVGDLYVVGTGVAADMDNRLIRGTYTFCPTNAAYAAAGLAVAPYATVTGSGMSYTIESAGVPCDTWAQVKASLEAGNSVRLTKDVSVGGQGQAVHVNGGVAAEVELDLDGHTVDGYDGSGQAGENDRLFVLHGSSVYKLTIFDSAGGGGFVGHKMVCGHAGGFASVGDACQLVIDGGTISGFSSDLNGGAIMVDGGNAKFTMNGGTITNCTASGNGGAVCCTGKGGCLVTGGAFVGNMAGRGGTFATGTESRIDVLGGCFSNLTATAGSPFCHASGEDGSCRLYGGVWEGYDPATDSDDATLPDGCSCVRVGSNWIVGNDVEHDANDELTGGTYTFCPTNAEYAAAGVVVMEDIRVRESSTEPRTWTLLVTSEMLARPMPIAYTSAAVYTNGVLSAETSPGSGLWYVWSNDTATVVYTADANSFFEGGATVVTNSLDTSADPAVSAVSPPGLWTRAAYVDVTGMTQSAEARVIVESGSPVTWQEGWYVTGGDVKLSCGVQVAGAVKLILADGAKLTVDGSEHEAGIAVSGGDNSFTVYGQADGTGELVATGGEWGGAGIGGRSEEDGSNITINGGRVTATSGYDGAGIGGGLYGAGSNITINGGTVMATAVDNGAGIGGGIEGVGTNITINGGTVTATGGRLAGAGIGGGHFGAGTGITINGGTVTATGGETGAGIGGGSLCTGSDITICGGRVTATGGLDVGPCDGIGNGLDAEVASSNIRVSNDMLVKAGDPEGPLAVIPHTSIETDIAPLLSGRTIVSAESLLLTMFLAQPTPVAHATAAVYTNGVLSAEAAAGSGLWHAVTNGTATVVYTADAGCFFEGGATVATNGLDTTVNPAVNAETPPRVVAPVAYVDADGRTQTATAHILVSDESRVTWSEGWYAVESIVTIPKGVNVAGAVKLILADGAKLTIDGVGEDDAGVGVSGDGNSFTVYGQAAGTGELDVTGGRLGAGIGGGWKGAGSNIMVNGGTVKAQGGEFGAGIGGGNTYSVGGAAGKDITINGGTVTATGGKYGSGIGVGYHGAVSNITINGGLVTATGGLGSIGGIGCGRDGTCSGVYIADGLVLKAGPSANPTEVIPHKSPTTDVTASLAGKQYVTAAFAYPDYLASYGDAVKAKFDVWATTFGSRDPDGVYTNAFLLNVETNREAEAVEAFVIGSIAVTNGVVDVELPEPLLPATSFNGDVWLRCATNLPAADWKDVESGCYIEEKGSFLRCLIDFEHTLTPGTFPTEPEGTKTIRVFAR